jgi:hypothetical protein
LRGASSSSGLERSSERCAASTDFVVHTAEVEFERATVQGPSAFAEAEGEVSPKAPLSGRSAGGATLKRASAMATARFRDAAFCRHQ